MTLCLLVWTKKVLDLKVLNTHCVYLLSVLNLIHQGCGTRDHLLIRVLVSRSEVDLKKVIEEYKAMFGRSLQEDILVNSFSALLPEVFFYLILFFETIELTSDLFNRPTRREIIRKFCSACVDLIENLLSSRFKTDVGSKLLFEFV